jgi:hypothetical protein
MALQCGCSTSHHFLNRPWYRDLQEIVNRNS